MNTHDSTHQVPDPADRSGSDGATAAGAKKKQKWGFFFIIQIKVKPRLVFVQKILMWLLLPNPWAAEGMPGLPG